MQAACPRQQEELPAAGPRQQQELPAAGPRQQQELQAACPRQQEELPAVGGSSMQAIIVDCPAVGPLQQQDSSRPELATVGHHQLQDSSRPELDDQAVVEPHLDLSRPAVSEPQQIAGGTTPTRGKRTRGKGVPVRQYCLQFKGNNSTKWDGKEIVVETDWLEGLYSPEELLEGKEVLLPYPAKGGKTHEWKAVITSTEGEL